MSLEDIFSIVRFSINHAKATSSEQAAMFLRTRGWAEVKSISSFQTRSSQRSRTKPSEWRSIFRYAKVWRKQLASIEGCESCCLARSCIQYEMPRPAEGILEGCPIRLEPVSASMRGRLEKWTMPLVPHSISVSHDELIQLRTRADRVALQDHHGQAGIPQHFVLLRLHIRSGYIQVLTVAMVQAQRRQGTARRHAIRPRTFVPEFADQDNSCTVNDLADALEYVRDSMLPAFVDITD